MCFDPGDSSHLLADHERNPNRPSSEASTSSTSSPRSIACRWSSRAWSRACGSSVPASSLCSTACQYAALFTWPRRSTSVTRSGHGLGVPSLAGIGSSSLVETVRPSVASAYRPKSLEPSGPSVGAEVDPDAVELDPPAAITNQRHPSAGGKSARTAAPRGQRDVIVLDGRHHHVDSNVAHDPQVVGGAPASLVDVIHCDVLEIARNGVQPQPTGGIPVGETDAPVGAEHPAGTRASVRAVPRQLRSNADRSHAVAAARCAGSISCATPDSW